MTPKDTRVLTERAAAGDEEAVALLVERYLPGVRAFVRAQAADWLRARESSSDLVQSVCREVLTDMGRFRYAGENAFKHWLFTTAQRKIADRAAYWRREKRDVGREEPPADGERRWSQLAQAYRELSSPSAQAVRAEDVARIEAALDALTDEHREVVVLAHLMGLSRAEIAERTGRSEGAVRALLFRALGKLSRALDEPAG